MNKNCKIVMITMFKNESSVIKRMLDSCLPYVDYYVLQNNGSTDGTDQIVKDFLVDNGLSGELYEVEEGWVGFGWNRDHLLQYCQKSDHGCDWILKMDCDEVLEIDDDFDWSPLDNKATQAFHIPAVSGNCIYHRAWMWNASLPWRFNHDTCHETISCELPGVGENFERVDLSSKFRQVGYNEGQSWSNPVKFISDSLILEEKMIKENTIFSDLYHFWYIGKSYNDAYTSTAFPLGRTQQEEYARRAIYYFDEYVKHRQQLRGGAVELDEMSYMGLIFSAECYKFIGQPDQAIETFKRASVFAPERNDHLFGIADVYHTQKDFKNMLAHTSIMMQPERVNPFPKYVMFIDTSMYVDSSTGRVQQLHQIAQEGAANEQNLLFFINKETSKKRMFIVDNFYRDPDWIREFALNAEYKADSRWYKGLRTVTPYRPDGIVEAFESIIGEKITNFPDDAVNGCFQITTAEDPQVYHHDLQKWAAMIYLTPNAPLQSGTRLHRSRINGVVHSDEPNSSEAFSGGFYDSTKFDITDSAANIYNRLVIMDAKCIHSAGPYFGQGIEDGRLTHLFFFD